MAISPPVIDLVDTTKVDNVESTIDTVAGAANWFANNVQIESDGSPYWEGTVNTYLNTKERVVLRDRYLAVGWRVVRVVDPDGTQTKTRVRVYL